MTRRPRTTHTLAAALTALLAGTAAAQRPADGAATERTRILTERTRITAHAAAEHAVGVRTVMNTAAAIHVPMMVSPAAKNAGLQGATGFADVDVEHGVVDLTVTLAEGSSLPAGTVLEGWLSSAGRKGGPGMSSASERDQKYGPAFGMPHVAALSRDIPYALSTGLLRREGSTQMYRGHFQIDNTLTPYGAVAVTLESDGNVGSYDPRPGTPLLAGMLHAGAAMGAMKADGMKADGMQAKKGHQMEQGGAMKRPRR